MVYKFSNDVRLNGNPAIVNIDTGEVLINKSIWRQLSDYEKILILLHEEGHYKGKTVDEIKADAYMVDKYLQESDTPERRYQIVKTIFGNLPNSKDNAMRKAKLVKYLLQWDINGKNSDQSRRLAAVLDDNQFYASFDPATIGMAVQLIDTGLKLTESIYTAWQAYQNRTKFWHDFSAEQKREIINSAADTVIQAEFFRLSGNFNELQMLAYQSPGVNSSLACKSFELIARTVPMHKREFNNQGQMSVAQASQIFWSKQGYTLPKWFVQRCDHLKPELEQAWSSLSIIDKIRYSNTYKIYAALFVVAGFLIYKYA